MNPYSVLAKYYDDLTCDVPYEEWAEYICGLFTHYGAAPGTILDLACGTGTLTHLLSRRGYDMIGVDASEDMLSMARSKNTESGQAPFFIRQNMESLDLYGTVDACISCLDSLNYITDTRVLERVLKRVYMFLAEGGLFIFDLNTREKLESLDAQAFVRETDRVFCVWQASYSQSSKKICYEIDLFEKNDSGYLRHCETHYEKGYSTAQIQKLLIQAGFSSADLYGELSFGKPAGNEQRVFFVARKGYS